MPQDSPRSSVYKSPSDESETGKPRAALPKRFVKLPTKLLGKILDYTQRKNAVGGVVIHGHASANAIHALAIKLDMPGHVLNEHNVKKRFGVGWRRFGEGLAVLKQRGVLERTQEGRLSYASERIIGDIDGAFVPLDRTLLAERSKLVAFVAAVNLSPDPQRPADVAARFGITSPATIRELVEDAKAGGHIAHHEDATSGRILVAREDYVFGDTISDRGGVKNGATKNGATKNGVHRKMGDSSGMGEPRNKKKKSYRTPSLRDGGPRALQRERDEIFLAKKKIQPLKPERIILANWRTSAYFRVCLANAPATDKEPPLDLASWRWWLNYFGGAPAHLHTEHAHRQAADVAHVLSGACPTALRSRPHLAMVGLAYAVCCEHERGREIRSLAFIAQPLCEKAMARDDTWAYDVPLDTDQERVTARKLAQQAADALATWRYGIRLDRRELLTTYSIELLVRMIKAHTWSRTRDAIHYVTSNQIRQGEGRVIACWTWFEPYIEPAKAAKAAAAAAAAAQPQPQPQPQPAAPPKGPSETEVEAACEWLRSYLGSTWHNSQRLKGAAKEVGISREAIRAAMERVERQTIRGPNYQWITAMPGIPLPMADDGDIIGTIKAADHNCLVANRLYRQGAQPLLAYVRSQAEKHGCTQDDVINDILEVLRLASSSEYGARQRVLESLIGANCGIGKPRYDVTHWTDFNRLVGRAASQKEKTG